MSEKITDITIVPRNEKIEEEIRRPMEMALRTVCAALNVANGMGLKVEWAYAPNEYGRLEPKPLKIFREI